MSRSRFPLRLLLVTASALTLAGCVQTKLHQSNDFGRSLAFDLNQQIPQPTPEYVGLPAPGSDGARVGLAQERYARDRIIQPSTLSSSKIGVDATASQPAYSPPDR